MIVKTARPGIIRHAQSQAGLQQPQAGFIQCFHLAPGVTISSRTIKELRFEDGVGTSGMSGRLDGWPGVDTMNPTHRLCKQQCTTFSASMLVGSGCTEAFRRASLFITSLSYGTINASLPDAFLKLWDYHEIGTSMKELP